MGERIVLTTMTANQHLQRFMLLREFKAYNIEKIMLKLMQRYQMKQHLKSLWITQLLAV
jgi:DNA-binding TFAR19-related protein (PDSD5 family)